MLDNRRRVWQDACMTNTTITHEIRLSTKVTMEQDASDGPFRRTIRGLDREDLDMMQSGDGLTITDDEGTWIGDILDVVPEYGYIWIEFL